MRPSPLHLESHFFTRLHLDVCPEGCDTGGDGRTTTNVECFKREDDPGRWMVEFTLCRERDDELGCPEYTFDIEIIGFFTVSDEYPKERADVLVHANGAAVLYGAVREMVANLTSRGPFAPVTLPTVTFIDELQAPSSAEKGPLKRRTSRRPGPSESRKARAH